MWTGRRLSVLRHAPCSRSRGGQPRHVRPARAPRDRALLLRLPAPSALQGCFLNLPTEAFDEAFSSSGLLTTEPCATVTTMPCPTPRPAVRRRRWRSTRPRTSSTSRRQRCAYLPPDLCPSASLTEAMPRSGGLCWSDSDLVCFNGQLIPAAEFANALRTVTISPRARYLRDHGPRRRRARPRPRSAAQEAAAQLAREAWLASIPPAKPSWRRPRAEIQQAEIERLEGRA